MATVLDDLARGTRLYHKKLQQMCEPVNQYYGITSTGYVKITNDGRLINLHTDINWLEHCLEKKYFIDDPHMIHPDKIGTGFKQWSSYKKEDYQNGMLKEMVDNFNICHGITYVEKNADGYELFGFATTKENYQIHDTLMSSADILKKFIVYFKNQLVPIHDALTDYQIDFPKLKGPSYYQQEAIIAAENDDVSKRAFLVQIGALDKKILEVNFTKREKDAIKHYLHGKTAEQTADLMCISPRTVEGYMENIKNKLQIKYKRELFEKVEELHNLGIV